MKLGVSTKGLSYGQSFSKDFLKSLKVKVVEYYANTTYLTTGTERFKKLQRIRKKFSISIHLLDADNQSKNTNYSSYLYYWYKYFIEYAQKVPFENINFHMPIEMGSEKRNKEIIAELQKTNIAVSVENNAAKKDPYSRLEIPLEFAEKHGFNILIDLGHLYRFYGKKFLQELEKHDLGKVDYIHLHDVKRNNDHLEIGKGEIGMNNMLRALDIIKPKYVIVETNTPEAAKNSLEKIRKQL